MPTIAPDSPGADGNSVRSYHAAGRLIIEITGNLSLYNLDALTAAFVAGAAADDRSVTLDVTRVSHIDSSGLALIVRHSKPLRTPEKLCALRLVVMEGTQPDRVLKLGNFSSILEIGYALEG